MRDLLKNYATPLVVAVFVALATTGLLIFFELGSHEVKELHEWIGLTFVVAASLHIAWNWRPLLVLLSRVRARATVSVIIVLAALAIIYAATSGEGGGEGGSGRQVVAALGRAPIATVAPALGVTADEAIARLKAKGITVSGPNQSLNEIARVQGRGTPALLSTMMGTTAGQGGGVDDGDEGD